MLERRRKPAESLAGSLLLAHPVLQDPNFRRTAILMSTHGPEGAMGVVLNRPLGKRLGELKGDFALGPLASTPIFTGGPVQTEQLILAAWQSKEDAFQLHFGIDPERAAQMVADQSTKLRAYLGYSGWSAGQLENELECGTWIVATPPADLFERPMKEVLWRTLLSDEGGEWRLMAEEPDEPGKN
ncbi:MAG TPA: YqgE/AlgH family protein [Opitutaceae bacterium]|jgi:putative transcriptional regulator